MNSFALVVIALISLFPAPSFAQNVTGNTQTTNLNSTTIGHGNVNVTETRQSIIDLQKSGYYGTNVSGTTQDIHGNATTIGGGNIDIKKAEQEALNGQKTK